MDPFPHRFITETGSSFVMHGHKGPQPHRLIAAQGPVICYAWPQRPSATQADYSTMALSFVMHGHKRPSATQANYSIMVLLFVMHGHNGPQPHRLITA